MNVNLVDSSSPTVGVTVKLPGTGGPLVDTVMAAFDPPQESVKVKVEYKGSELGNSTKFPVHTLPGRTLTEVAVEAIFASDSLGSSTLHTATAPVVELPMLTVVLRISLRNAATAVEGVPIA